MRRLASIFMWCPQSGHTLAFSWIVFENAIFPHASLGHFVQRPAGISFFLRKDQAMASSLPDARGRARRSDRIAAAAVLLAEDRRPGHEDVDARRPRPAAPSRTLIPPSISIVFV